MSLKNRLQSIRFLLWNSALCLYDWNYNCSVRAEALALLNTFSLVFLSRMYIVKIKYGKLIMINNN